MLSFHSKDTMEIILLVIKITFVVLIDTRKLLFGDVNVLFHEKVCFSLKNLDKILGQYEKNSLEKFTVLKLEKHWCVLFLFKSRTIRVQLYLEVISVAPRHPIPPHSPAWTPGMTALHYVPWVERYRWMGSTNIVLRINIVLEWEYKSLR